MGSRTSNDIHFTMYYKTYDGQLCESFIAVEQKQFLGHCFLRFPPIKLTSRDSRALLETGEAIIPSVIKVELSVG